MKYIFLDIDGTLFDHKEYAIPESAYRAVDLARKAGNKVFICTGRSCCLLDHVKDISFDGVVAAAGAYVQAQDEVIYEDAIPDEELQEIMEFCVKNDVSYVLEGKKGIYMHSMVRKYFFEGEGRKRPGHEFFKQKTVHGVEDYNPENEIIYKFCIYTMQEEGLREVEKRYGRDYQFIRSISGEGSLICIEVMSVRNNKAKGIHKILEYYGGGMEDTVAVGDSLNDLEMIQECAVGIVMGNGNEKLKACADYITADIGEDGVYQALEHYGLLG